MGKRVDLYKINQENKGNFCDLVDLYILYIQ